MCVYIYIISIKISMYLFFEKCVQMILKLMLKINRIIEKTPEYTFRKDSFLILFLLSLLNKKEILWYIIVSVGLVNIQFGLDSVNPAFSLQLTFGDVREIIIVSLEGDKGNNLYLQGYLGPVRWVRRAMTGRPENQPPKQTGCLPTVTSVLCGPK